MTLSSEALSLKSVTAEPRRRLARQMAVRLSASLETLLDTANLPSGRCLSVRG